MDSNPAADDILGVDCRKLIGRTIEDAFPSLADTDLPEKYRLACRENRPWQTESFAYKDSRIEGNYKVNAFQFAPGSVAVMFENITRQKLIEQELQKIHKLESIGTLAGGIAHDFNNLLTVIIGNISLVKSVERDNQSIAEKLTNAEKASCRAQSLTQQLLTFSKGGTPIRKVKYINELINDSSTFILSGSNVNCEIRVADDLKPVLVDEGQLSQVIQNLVKNADQAMPGGGIISIQADNFKVGENSKLPLNAGDYVRVTFEDHGPGIPKKNLTKIFDPYFTTKTKGSGLGLAVAHSIVSNHSGLLTAESSKGSGSKFSVYLPAVDCLPAAPPILKETELPSCPGKILVMDDEKAILKVASDILNHLGYENHTAANGSEALTIFEEARNQQAPFDGVILDLTIPGAMGGEETIKHLRRIDPEIKAIVSSGYANDRIMSAYEDFGFNGVVTKPYTLEEMKRAMSLVFG